MQLIEWPPQRLDVRVFAYPAALLLCLGLILLALGANRALFLALNEGGQLAPNWFWATVTHLGDTLVASALLVLVARRHAEVVWTVLLAAIVASIYTRGLKPLLDVPRPPSLLSPGSFNLIGPSFSSASFPSGHSSTIATLCGVLAIHTRSWGFRACLVALTLAVGVSRVVVGVHWPLDVIFGWLGGWLAACSGYCLYARWLFWRGPRAHRIQLGMLLVAAITVIGHDGGYRQGEWLSWLIGLPAAALAALGLWESRRESSTEMGGPPA